MSQFTVEKINDSKSLVMNLQKVHKQGGSLNDLADLYTDAADDSQEYKDVKQKISQALTQIRNAMKKAAEKAGIPVSVVMAKIPSFRENRMTGGKAARAELFDFLVADESATEDSAE